MNAPLAILHSGFRRGAAIRPFGVEMANRGFDVHFRHLPGHADMPLIDPLTMDAISEQFTRWLDQSESNDRTIIVGESLAGLAALRVAADPPKGLKAVFAIDPPFTMARQWALHRLYEGPWDSLHPLIRAYWDIFGARRHGNGQVHFEERDYRPFLSNLKLPVHILIGGRRGEGPSPRSVVDEEDREVLSRLDGVTLHVMGPEVGHLVLDEDQTAAADLITALAAKAM